MPGIAIAITPTVAQSKPTTGGSAPPDHAILDNLNSAGAGVNAEILDDLNSGGAGVGANITDP